MPNTSDILKLKKQLLPKGRAFKVPANSNFEKLLLGMAGKESQAISDIIGMLDTIIPDNASFSAEDAAQWESFFALAASAELDARKAAIYRKMQFPANVKGRQHAKYLEWTLSQAGFDCQVYEWIDIRNKLSSITHSANTQHASSTRHGGMSIPAYSGIVANFIKQADEVQIPNNIQNLKNIFWICGKTGFDSFVDVSDDRMDEFRHIILTIKPLHTVAYYRLTNLGNWILEDGTWNMSGEWINSALWS